MSMDCGLDLGWLISVDGGMEYNYVSLQLVSMAKNGQADFVLGLVNFANIYKMLTYAHTYSWNAITHM